MLFEKYTIEELDALRGVLAELGRTEDIAEIDAILRDRKNAIKDTFIKPIEKLIEDALQLGYELYITTKDEYGDFHTEALSDYAIFYRHI